MKSKRRNKTRLYLYVPFWLLIAGMFIGLLAIQYSRYEGYRQELNRLQAELEREQQIAMDIRHRQAFYESDAYIEQLAREMLNFVREDEIIFQNIAE